MACSRQIAVYVKDTLFPGDELSFSVHLTVSTKRVSPILTHILPYYLYTFLQSLGAYPMHCCGKFLAEFAS